MRLHRDRIILAKTLRKYVRLGLADKKLGEYEKISIIKGHLKMSFFFSIYTVQLWLPPV